MHGTCEIRLAVCDQLQQHSKVVLFCLCSNKAGAAGARGSGSDAQKGALYEDGAHVQKAQARQEAPGEVAEEATAPPQRQGG